MLAAPMSPATPKPLLQRTHGAGRGARGCERRWPEEGPRAPPLGCSPVGETEAKAAANMISCL